MMMQFFSSRWYIETICARCYFGVLGYIYILIVMERALLTSVGGISALCQYKYNNYVTLYVPAHFIRSSSY